MQFFSFIPHTSQRSLRFKSGGSRNEALAVFKTFFSKKTNKPERMLKGLQLKKMLKANSEDAMKHFTRAVYVHWIVGEQNRKSHPPQLI